MKVDVGDMKICIVSRGDLSLFFPTQGASVKLYNTVKHLSLLGVRVFFVTAENDQYFEVKNRIFKRKKYPYWLAKSPVTKRMKKILSWFGIPPEIFPLYHPLINFKLWLKVLYVAIKERVNLIQAEFTCFGIPAIFTKLLTSIPVCLVEHNVETFQIPETTSISKRGRRIVKAIEKFVCNFSDRIIAITKEDKKRLEILGICNKKIKIIPHGIDLGFFKKTNGKKVRKKFKLKFPTLIFHGVYSYKANYDAVKIIAKKILPKLEKEMIKTRVLAVGDFPPKDVKHSNLIFTGVVNNLPDYIDAADIAIVPIQAGGGMRMKILEYFASKKPVISTRKGVEGIPVKNGEEIILADIEEFPKKIVKLIKSRKLRKEIAENAFRFVQDYDWKKICKKYVEIYRQIL
ncbi:MAG: glycosyltransferase family 4 protein [Candidatus Aenigmarchaeota archaeon]|nr:glycosyltransferase family 4 protein [Candidatus Aenigmarchaeota archaeon]